MKKEYNIEGKPLRLHELNIEGLANTLCGKRVRTSQGKLLQPLHDAHLEIITDPARFKVLACGRRFGKSLIVSLVALAALFQTKRRIWVVAPDYSLGEKVFRELYNLLVNQLGIIIPGKRGKARSQKGDYYLETPWGSVLEVKSLENPDSLAGEANDLVIVDEAALNDQIEDIWTQMIQPTLMDKEGSAIFISCLTEDTWINTVNGLEQIKDYKNDKQGFSECAITLNTGLKRFSHVTQFWNNGKITNNIKLNFSSGATLEGTEDHPVLALDERTAEVEWTQLKDLTEYHYIAKDRNKIIFGIEDDTDFFEYNTHGDCSFRLPSKIEPDLAYLMGVILINGRINNSRVTISPVDEQTEQFLLSSPYGLEFKSENHHISVDNRKFSEFLRQFGFKETSNKETQIPHKLFKCSETVVSNFLSGIFDTSGQTERYSEIRYTTPSKKLFEQIILLTQSFGIYGTASETTDKEVNLTNYELELYGNHSKVFFEDIGFRLDKNQEYSKNCRDWSPSDGIPGVHNLIKASNLKLPRSLNHIRSTKANSYKTLKRLETCIKENKKESEDIQKLQVLIEQKFYWDSVKSTERTEGHTYDFKVPTTESFWANSTVSHNTPRGMNQFYKLFLFGKQGNAQRKNPKLIKFDESLGVDNDMTEWSSFQKTSYDNPLLSTSPEKSKQEIDKAYKRAIHAGKTVKFKQEYLADFEAVADIVFPGFKSEANEHVEYPNVVEYDWHPDEGPIFSASDHNFAKPSSTIFAQINKENDVIIFDERFTPRTTTYEQARQILDKQTELNGTARLIWKEENRPIQEYHNIEFQEVIADISGNQVQLNGRRAWDDFESVLGYRPVGLKQDRETGCNMIRLWSQYPEFDKHGNIIKLKNGEIKSYPKLFVSANCVNLIYALSTAKFRRTKAGGLKEDYEEVVEGYEGLLDALRYLFVYVFHERGQTIEITGGF